MCDQCGPEWSANEIRSTPLRSLSLSQLDQVLQWLRQPIIGERLSAAKLDAAEELWRVCGQ